MELHGYGGVEVWKVQSLDPELLHLTKTKGLYVSAVFINGDKFDHPNQCSFYIYPLLGHTLLSG